MGYYSKETCETCIYRHNMACRRFPPTHHFNLINSISFFPSVKKIGDNDKEIYQKACAEWHRKRGR